MTFKVGDIITGIPGSSKFYGITNEFSTLRVEKMVGEDAIWVKVLKAVGYGRGTSYVVKSRHFRLLSEDNFILDKIAFMEKRWKERYES